MTKKKNSYLVYLPLIVLLIVMFALTINNYNSGVYADAHQFNGASVGWLAPHGMLVLVLSAIATACYIFYLVICRKN